MAERELVLRVGWFTRGLLIGLALIALSWGSASAVEIGQVDDFEDMTTQGWGGNNGIGAVNPNPPLNVEDPMDSGNRALQISSRGAGGAGSRLVALSPEPRWQGDYPAAGVVAIEFEAINLGANDLFLRVALRTLQGDTAVSAVPLSLPAQDAEWVVHEFSLAAEDLDCVPACDPASVIADVSEVRILSSANGASQKGDRIAGSLGVDEITALPEPAAAAQAIGLLVALACWHRGCRARSLERAS